MAISGTDLVWILAAYLTGCFTAGYYWVRWRTGEDIRDHGSGYVGARNVGRRLGSWGFLSVFILDFVKGALVLSGTLFLDLNREISTATLLAVIAGHLWPIQLRFRGGKGIAVSLGALLVYSPPVVLILVATFLPLWGWLRNFLVAGMIAYAVAPLVIFLCGLGPLTAFGMSGSAMLIVLAHRVNLRDELTGMIASNVPAANDKETRENSTS